MNVIFNQTLRQEYLAKLEGVQAEIERHSATLKSRKEAQQTAINRLQHEKRGLMETATKLSETYDDLTVNNQKLSSRLEKVLLKVQQQLPVRSDAELRMQRELIDVERKMKNLKNGKFLSDNASPLIHGILVQVIKILLYLGLIFSGPYLHEHT